MRHVCLDTETTGFDPNKGDRICEIACVELYNYLPTGNFFHKYVNPNRDVPQAAFEVHGLSTEFLKDKPLFVNVADEFIEFIQDSPLVIHNASFDMKFLNAELRWAKKAIIDNIRAIDTLILARQKYPGSPASLDALCKRFNISLQDRTKHGALIDTKLLAEVYLNLCEGRAPSLTLEVQEKKTVSKEIIIHKVVMKRTKKLASRLKQQEKDLHESFIQTFKKKTLWDLA